jgi:molybdopterin molybdotransferase
MDFFRVKDIGDVLAFRHGFGKALVESLGLENALGRVLARDSTSSEDIPPFSRTTVDGYAVAAASTFGAGETNPSLLRIKGEVRMAEVPGFSLGPGEAARIPTGGCLPEGTDAAVMLEHAEAVDGEFLEVYRSIAPGTNVIFRGDDVRTGEVAVPAGTRLRPQELAVLAAMGKVELEVFKRPVVGIISTGDEIVPAGGTPGAGQIRDMNAHALAGQVRAAQAVPEILGIVPDSGDELYTVLAKAMDICDTVLISGGSSVGSRDFTVNAIARFPEAGILAHGVAISPGKPTILARIGNIAVWGLPGHAVSAMVVFEVLVRPFIENFSGLADGGRLKLPVPARLSMNIPSVSGRTDFVRVKLGRAADGTLEATPIFGKSGEIRTMTRASGLVRIERDHEGVAAGTMVDVFPME